VAAWIFEARPSKLPCWSYDGLFAIVRLQAETSVERRRLRRSVSELGSHVGEVSL